jgi:basic amino acid/polyamine antiporter, APA family
MSENAAASAISPASDGKLHGSIGAVQYFALGFGTIIGSAWVVLMGDWLTEAGPGGAMLGFFLGGVVIMVIGYVYAELIKYLPEAGSEFIYAYRIFGPMLGYFVGWFLIIYLVGVTVYEAIALPWLLEVLAPSLRGGSLYSAFGSSITTDALAIGIGVGIVVTILNLFGVKVAVRFHSIMTAAFITIAVLTIVSMIYDGHWANAQPFFASATAQPWWVGAASVFTFCAYGLNGFQAIPQTIEERSNNIALSKVGAIVVLSIGAAAVFYVFVVFGVGLAAPWQQSIKGSLAAVSAASAISIGRYAAPALLIATTISLLKAWNGIYMMAVRLLIAMARVGLFPKFVAHLDPRHGAPRIAILIIGVLNIIGIFFGRGAVEPITDMCAMVMTLTYIMCCATVLLLRARDIKAGQPKKNNLLIYIGMAISLVTTVAAFGTPWLQSGGRIPLEWKLLGAWTVIGLVLWFAYARHASHRHRQVAGS